MKKDFMKFQISKEAMNQLRGGDAFSCSCGNGKSFTSAMPHTVMQLVDAINSICGDSGGSCTRN